MLVATALVVIFGLTLTFVMVGSQLRRQRHDLGGRTKRYYALSGPRSEMPTVAELVAVLERRGYRLRVERVAAEDQFLDVAIDRDELILRDHRLPAGRLHVAISGADDRVFGEMTSWDDGPEFYEEMAQYAIAALSESLPGLRYTRPGVELTPAESLADELPDAPLGLSLLEPG